MTRVGIVGGGQLGRMLALAGYPLGIQCVTLDPGETRTVTWTLDASDVGFYDNAGRFVVEPGAIDVFAGDSSSASDLTGSFTVTGR